MLKTVARALMARDALRADEHGGLALGPSARSILKGEEPVALTLAPKPERSRRRAGRSANAAVEGDPLFEALRQRRRELAREAGVPPYVVFHDAVLRDMAAARPATLRGLGEISGVGQRKLEAYGQAFLDVLNGSAASA